jgi:hypothetical protein
MPRFPTPFDALMLSVRSSIALAEAGRTFWTGVAAAGLVWMPPALRPVPLPVKAAPARPARSRKARG